MPDGATKRVKLPRAEGYEIGATVLIEETYNKRPFKLRIVRVLGGWQVAEKQ